MNQVCLSVRYGFYILATMFLLCFSTPSCAQYMDECRFQGYGSSGIVLARDLYFPAAMQKRNSPKRPGFATACTPIDELTQNEMTEAQYKKAIDLLDSALKSYPNQERARRNFANVFFKQAINPDLTAGKKMSLLRLSLHCDPGDQSLRKALASSLLAEKDDRLNRPDRKKDRENRTDETEIKGYNTAGTVRAGTLARIEAMLNLIANGLQTLGVAWGGPTMIFGFMRVSCMLSIYDSRKKKWVPGKDGVKRVVWGAFGVLGALAVPGIMNWLVSSARTAGLFG